MNDVQTPIESIRLEHDTMGVVKVPGGVCYGAQTARAVENFPISNLRLQRNFIWALGLIKAHASSVNVGLKLLDPEIGNAVTAAACDVKNGQLDKEFVVDVFQSGSATSTNMNANEVIAHRAQELLSLQASKTIHPNDHVNLCQSSNDVIPSCIHLSALRGLRDHLIPSIKYLRDALQKKADEFDTILKVGRTHMQDAAPIRVGQEFSGYVAQLDDCLLLISNAERVLEELPLGGTAVGTGLNSHPEFATKVIQAMGEEVGWNIRKTRNHFAAQGSKDGCVFVSGVLRTYATALIKIGNDIRWLSSGPRCGIGELKLRAVQPGSSIMPGKSNPVIVESMLQACVHVLGNDAVISLANTLGGNCELNTMMPLIAYHLNQAIELLGKISHNFAVRCVAHLEVDRERCHEHTEKNLILGAALAPIVGYDTAAEIIREADKQGSTVREVACLKYGFTKEELDEILDPLAQSRGGIFSRF
jgi:fumarate hydratase, class II